MHYPPFDAILVPTDFEPGSLRAFHHALLIVLQTRGELRVLHVHDAVPHTGVPHIRETLQAWRRLEGNEDLGIEVKRVEAAPGDVADRILQDVAHAEPNLLVMSTHGRDPLSILFHRRITEPVLRRSGIPILVLPPDASGFVNQWGEFNLENVMVTIASSPDPGLALEGAARLITSLGAQPGTLNLFHVNDGTPHPAVSDPALEGWTVNRQNVAGDVVPTILMEATATKADVLVMSTAGHQSPGDWLLGSTAERVLRAAPCPVLLMPTST